MRWKRERFCIAAAPACRAIKLRTELTLSPVGYVEQRRSGLCRTLQSRCRIDGERLGSRHMESCEVVIGRRRRGGRTTSRFQPKVLLQRSA